MFINDRAFNVLELNISFSFIFNLILPEIQLYDGMN